MILSSKHPKQVDFHDDAFLEGGYYSSEEVPAPDPPPRRVRKFRPETCDQIVRDVEAGAFAHVAARAAGITMATLGRWRRDPEKAEFAERLATAEAQARVSAETRVHREKPVTWLKIGPGRDQGDPERPGWTSAPRQVNVRGQHVHAHAAVDARPRVAVDLSRLSTEELRQLQQITHKLMPAGVKQGAIEVEVGED